MASVGTTNSNNSTNSIKLVEAKGVKFLDPETGQITHLSEGMVIPSNMTVIIDSDGSLTLEAKGQLFQISDPQQFSLYEFIQSVIGADFLKGSTIAVAEPEIQTAPLYQPSEESVSIRSPANGDSIELPEMVVVESKERNQTNPSDAITSKIEQFIKTADRMASEVGEPTDLAEETNASFRTSGSDDAILITMASAEVPPASTTHTAAPAVTTPAPGTPTPDTTAPAATAPLTTTPVANAPAVITPVTAPILAVIPPSQKPFVPQADQANSISPPQLPTGTGTPDTLISNSATEGGSDQNLPPLKVTGADTGIRTYTDFIVLKAITDPMTQIQLKTEAIHETKESDSKGQVSFKITDLQPGSFEAEVTAVNQAGDKASQSVHIDIIPAFEQLAVTSHTVDSSSGSVIHASEIRISGKSPVNKVVAIYHTDASGTEVMTYTPVDGNGNWLSAPYPLTKAGNNPFNLQLFNQDLTTKLTPKHSFSVPHDAQVDQFTLGINDPCYTSANPLVIKGTLGEYASVKASLKQGDQDKATALTNANTTFQLDFMPISGQLTEGSYTLEATATDQAGNTHTLTRQVIIDTTPPAAPIHTTVANATLDQGVYQLRGNRLKLSGYGEDPGHKITVKLSTGETFDNIEVKPGKTWSLDVPLKQPGTLSIEVFETDHAGLTSAPTTLQTNLAAVSASPSSAPGQPVILAIVPDSGISQTDFLTNQNIFALSIRAEPDNMVQVLQNQQPLGSHLQADSSGHCEVVINTPEPQGKYVFTAIALDKTGQQSPVSAPQTVSVDTIEPTLLSVSTPKPLESYSTGDKVPFSLDFSKNVIVTDKPKLGLSIDGTDYEMDIKDVNGKPVAYFPLSSNAPDLNKSKLVLAGLTFSDPDNGKPYGSIEDAAGNSASSDTSQTQLIFFGSSAPIDSTPTDTVDAAAPMFVEVDFKPVYITTLPAFTAKLAKPHTEIGAVEFKINNETVAATYNEQSGYWQALPAHPLPEGEYKASFIARDLAGNHAIESAKISIHPIAYVASECIQNAAETSTFYGTGVSGSTVILKLTDSATGKELQSFGASVNQNGHWQASSPVMDLSPGRYTLSYYPQDDDGGRGITLDQPFDILSPELSAQITDMDVWPDLSRGLVISGTATANSTVTVKLTEALSKKLTVGETELWEVTFNPDQLTSFSEGPLEVELTASLNGDQQVSYRSLYIDLTDPQLTATITDSAELQPTFSGTCIDPNLSKLTATLYNQQGEVVDLPVPTFSTATKIWSVTATKPLSDRNLILELQAEDNSGRRVTENYPCTISATSPATLNIEDLPAASDLVQPLLIQGSATPGAQILVELSQPNAAEPSKIYSVSANTSVEAHGKWSVILPASGLQGFVSGDVSLYVIAKPKGQTQTEFHNTLTIDQSASVLSPKVPNSEQLQSLSLPPEDTTPLATAMFEAPDVLVSVAQDGSVKVPYQLSGLNAGALSSIEMEVNRAGDRPFQTLKLDLKEGPQIAQITGIPKEMLNESLDLKIVATDKQGATTTLANDSIHLFGPDFQFLGDSFKGCHVYNTHLSIPVDETGKTYGTVTIKTLPTTTAVIAAFPTYSYSGLGTHTYRLEGKSDDKGLLSFDFKDLGLPADQLFEAVIKIKDGLHNFEPKHFLVSTAPQPVFNLDFDHSQTASENDPIHFRSLPFNDVFSVNSAVPLTVGSIGQGIGLGKGTVSMPWLREAFSEDFSVCMDLSARPGTGVSILNSPGFSLGVVNDKMQATLAGQAITANTPVVSDSIAFNHVCLSRDLSNDKTSSTVTLSVNGQATKTGAIAHAEDLDTAVTEIGEIVKDSTMLTGVLDSLVIWDSAIPEHQLTQHNSAEIYAVSDCSINDANCASVYPLGIAARHSHGLSENTIKELHLKVVEGAQEGGKQLIGTYTVNISGNEHPFPPSGYLKLTDVSREELEGFEIQAENSVSGSGAETTSFRVLLSTPEKGLANHPDFIANVGDQEALNQIVSSGIVLHSGAKQTGDVGNIPQKDLFSLGKDSHIVSFDPQEDILDVSKLLTSTSAGQAGEVLKTLMTPAENSAGKVTSFTLKQDQGDDSNGFACNVVLKEPIAQPHLMFSFGNELLDLDAFPGV